MPDFDKIALLAARAAAHEAAAVGKPGLVCADTRGAHADMDICAMLAGIMSIIPYFRRAAAIGFETAGESAVEVFAALRAEGLKADAAMLAATNGVNTHKGLIFSMGLFCAAAGKNLALGEPWRPASLCRAASGYAQGIAQRDFAGLNALGQSAGDPDKLRAALGRKPSAGELLYMRFKTTGIRGEAESGFPSVSAAVRELRRNLEKQDFNTALLNTLLALMATVEDTNVLWRGGPQGLNLIRRGAARVLALGGAATTPGREALRRLRGQCLQKRLSPGGSADLLSLALFAHFAETAPSCA